MMNGSRMTRQAVAWAGLALIAPCALATVRAAGEDQPAAAASKGQGQAQAQARRIAPAPWPLVDALGRTAPVADQAPKPKGDRFVGMFYFLWHNNRQGRPGGGVYDIAKILKDDPQALSHPKSPAWGPIGMYHYWGEPLYGYYRSDDPWVLRRHAGLLTAAGIDVLIFDTTNAVTYPKIYSKLCEVFQKVRADGGDAPAITFMVNTQAGATAQKIYDDLYKPGRFRDLWFQWKGKPLLVCDPEKASPELKKFFTLRRAHWPFTMVNTRDAWHWEATFPQPYGYHGEASRPEQVSVSVAQNLRAADGKVTNMSNGDARGRGFHDGKSDHSPGSLLRGRNFEEQWTRAFKLGPPFVLVTGWNEWIAGKFGPPEGPIAFVDQFDREYSRDIEPMRGGHGDNYYCQLVANVRRFKGASPLPRPSAARTIDPDGDFNQWADVAPEYRDDPADALSRDHDGVGGTHYTNHTGRNDLAVMKVARDRESIAFYARTKAPIKSGRPWLLIDADRDHKTGWEGYDFVVNRAEADDAGLAWLEKNDGNRWAWTKTAKVHVRGAGNELQIIIPRSALGLGDGSGATSFDFKWADNLQRPGDVMDFYVSGDVAPEGRFNFRYEARD